MSIPALLGCCSLPVHLLGSALACHACRATPGEPASPSPRHANCPQVVEEYTRLQPNNTLSRFLPALRSVAGRGDRFTGLDGFEAAVKQLASDKGKWRLLCLLGQAAVSGT